ncbi:Venom serine proteinase-like HS120 [Frankliniella fusca]|uniref:Venom serine proteinase-like HS120 n=1 Tax=Frankliniella fusca TaxID=407009 RepID=A0AAE1H0F3_9NEOP|nr:Venom serine proteinase-like HS120 [Frankliniella fusca]
MTRPLRLCPAVVATLVLATINPTAFCFQLTKLRGGSVSDVYTPPMVYFKERGNSDISGIMCVGALVSSTEVLTTKECSEKMKSYPANDVRAVSLGKEVAVSCADTRLEPPMLTMIRLEKPLCDKSTQMPKLQLADTEPLKGDICKLFYLKVNEDNKPYIIGTSAAITDGCQNSKSSFNIRGTGNKKLCVQIVNTTDMGDVIFPGFMLTCKDEKKVSGIGFALISLNPSNLQAWSVVGLDKESWYKPQGKECSEVEKPQPQPQPQTELPTCPAATAGPADTDTSTQTAITPGTATSPPASIATAASPSAAVLTVVRPPAREATFLAVAYALLHLVQPLRDAL